MTKKDQIKEILKDLSPERAIKLLEGLSMEYRKQNSIRINDKQMGRVVVDKDRPDLQSMKVEPMGPVVLGSNKTNYNIKSA